MTKEILPCSYCNSLKIPTVEEALWNIYNRLADGRSRYEPLVYTSDWLEENVNDEEDYAAVMHSMEKDMQNRGLCPKCGLPDLRDVKPEDILSDEDLESFQDMWAMEEMERRAGA